MRHDEGGALVFDIAPTWSKNRATPPGVYPAVGGGLALLCQGDGVVEFCLSHGVCPGR
jgi:hypothetical protein